MGKVEGRILGGAYREENEEKDNIIQFQLKTIKNKVGQVLKMITHCVISMLSLLRYKF